MALSFGGNSSLSTLSMSTSEISLAFARLPAAVTSNRFFAERRLKKPLICCDVRTSPGWNRRPPAWSLARLVVFETSCGSLFRPLYSPFWNWSVKNSVCFFVKRTFFLIVFTAHWKRRQTATLWLRSNLNAWYSTASLRQLGRIFSFSFIVESFLFEHHLVFSSI